MRFATTLIALAALTTPTVAQASSTPFELSVAPMTHILMSDSATALTNEAAHVAPTVRVGYEIIDGLDLYVGYRSLDQLHKTDDSGASWATDLHVIVAGARFRYPLAGSWLKAYGQLDLEASYAALKLDLGTRNGEQSVWSAGAVPEIGLEASIDIEDSVRFLLRLGVGYALRLDHDFDQVDVRTPAPGERPLDLGAANFSGLTVGFTLGTRF
ncbi:MAG: hypothetical protein EP329_24685 [Deltaproteobacteria bacterium]|nr:MAG: hypothetical protein EP329_24685 [Deltaproteobacteria bacterium]